MNHPNPDEWLELIAEYQQSGLSQKEFVAKHDIHFSTFQYWLYRKSKTQAKALRFVSKPSPKFLPIELVASPALKARVAKDGWVEASLRSGVTLRFAIGTDTRYLAELFAALG